VLNVIILITDGNSTWEIDLLPDEVRLIKSLGTRIIGVGVTNEVTDRLLFIHSDSETAISSSVMISWIFLHRSKLITYSAAADRLLLSRLTRRSCCQS